MLLPLGRSVCTGHHGTGLGSHPALPRGKWLPICAHSCLLGWQVQICRWPLPFSRLSQQKSRAAGTFWGAISSSPLPPLQSWSTNIDLPRLPKMILITQCDGMCSLGEGDSLVTNSSSWACPRQDLQSKHSCSVGTPMGSTRRTHLGEVLQPGPGRQGPAWRQRYWVRWRSRDYLIPGPLLCFIASVLFPLTRGKGEMLL